MAGTLGIPADSIDVQTLQSLVNVERVCSSLSILGCVFIITTFLSSKAFHKPINRLVFYASVGNVATNVATLISRSALGNVNGFLCQFQAFLIQMFMAADALWSLAMACNVYLTLYWKYDAALLRTMEKWYFLGCYGIPFVPAIVYIFVGINSQRMYGDALLWCWVSTEFDAIRIVTFYGPVWVATLITFMIYIRAGKDIYIKRKQIREFTKSDSLYKFQGSLVWTKTTEVLITRESINANSGLDAIHADPHSWRVPSTERPQYSVTVSSNAPQNGTLSLPRIPKSEYKRNYIRNEVNNAVLSYTKVALLFFTAMLVTWIPSSANRVFSIINPGRVSIPLLYASAFVLPLQGFWNAIIYITTSREACKSLFGRLFGCREPPSDNFNSFSMASIGSSTYDTRLASRGRSIGTGSTTEFASLPNRNDNSAC